MVVYSAVSVFVLFNAWSETYSIYTLKWAASSLKPRLFVVTLYIESLKSEYIFSTWRPWTQMTGCSTESLRNVSWISASLINEFMEITEVTVEYIKCVLSLAGPCTQDVAYLRPAFNFFYFSSSASPNLEDTWSVAELQLMLCWSEWSDCCIIRLTCLLYIMVI